MTYREEWPILESSDDCNHKRFGTCYHDDRKSYLCEAQYCPLYYGDLEMLLEILGDDEDEN